ncbi:hypothetical protein GCM10027452_29680 [Micromonospora halotolerans]
MLLAALAGLLAVLYLVAVGGGRHDRVAEGVVAALGEAHLVPAVPGDVAAGDQTRDGATPDLHPVNSL